MAFGHRDASSGRAIPGRLLASPSSPAWKASSFERRQDSRHSRRGLPRLEAAWGRYIAFYGRVGETALPAEVTQLTWSRFFDADEPMHAMVAESSRKLLGFAHFLYHRSTNQIGSICYLQDLFTLEEARATASVALLSTRCTSMRPRSVPRAFTGKPTKRTTSRGGFTTRSPKGPGSSSIGNCFSVTQRDEPTERYASLICAGDVHE